MPLDVKVKICGVKTAADIAVAAEAGAAYVGLNFFPKSPRYVTPEQARDLAVEAPMGIAKVGLFVNPDDSTLASYCDIVPLDLIQLHGAETPDRVAEIKARYGLPVIKVIGVGGAEDVGKIDLYSPVADQILVDTKAPKDALLPGGNGVSFDWSLINRKYWTKPWMLAGGLTPDTVARAVNLTGTRQVDVSSGVESAPGVKDPEKIRAFVQAAQQ